MYVRDEIFFFFHRHFVKSQTFQYVLQSIEMPNLFCMCVYTTKLKVNRFSDFFCLPFQLWLLPFQISLDFQIVFCCLLIQTWSTFLSLSPSFWPKHILTFFCNYNVKKIVNLTLDDIFLFVWFESLHRHLQTYIRYIFWIYIFLSSYANSMSTQNSFLFCIVCYLSLILTLCLFTKLKILYLQLFYFSFYCFWKNVNILFYSSIFSVVD